MFDLWSIMRIEINWSSPSSISGNTPQQQQQQRRWRHTANDGPTNRVKRDKRAAQVEHSSTRTHKKIDEQTLHTVPHQVQYQSHLFLFCRFLLFLYWLLSKPRLYWRWRQLYTESSRVEQTTDSSAASAAGKVRYCCTPVYGLYEV